MKKYPRAKEGFSMVKDLLNEEKWTRHEPTSGCTNAVCARSKTYEAEFTQKAK